MHILKKLFFRDSSLLRLISYLFIWVTYLYLMKNISPLGIGWLDWYGEKIFNFSEFLKLNGYLSFYGFSIWTDCSGCSLKSEVWTSSIYTSIHSISFIPYVLLNYFYGKEVLLMFGPIINMSIIFISGVASAELSREMLQKNSRLPLYITSITCFSFFALNPWTYKMIVQPWPEVSFLMFSLLGFLSFNKNFKHLGLILFFFAGLSHYQWSILIAVFYLLIVFASFVTKKDRILAEYFPASNLNYVFALKIVASFLISAFSIVIMQFLIGASTDQTSGSNLMYRIGISGIDIHNGGLLGALQFLGGNRITNCLNGIDIGILSSSLEIKILIFNCMLSISSMLIISIISIFGVIKMLRESPLSRPVILPLLFSILSMICILQQSLSVHLMGYSYIFSVVFSIGLVTIFASSFHSISSKIMRLIFSTPIVLGVFIVCIRVSMLTGVNG
jgi:hypothetical protein